MSHSSVLNSSFILGPVISFSDEEINESKKAEITSTKIRRKGMERKVMLPQTRTLLQTFYAPFNQKLGRLLGDDRFLWTE